MNGSSSGDGYLQPLNALGASENVTLAREGKGESFTHQHITFNILIHFNCFISVDYTGIGYSVYFVYLPQISNLPATKNYFNALCIFAKVPYPHPPKIFCSSPPPENVLSIEATKTKC